MYKIGDSVYYKRKSKHGSLKVSDMRRFRMMQTENA